jgi:hypothetical protein
MALNEGFTVHEHNPNDRIGGGGCLITGGHAGEDCEGPWIQFPRTSTEFHASPYAVICAKHLHRVQRLLPAEEVQTEGDPLPLRKAVPVTREDTGLRDFEGVAGIRVEV